MQNSLHFTTFDPLRDAPEFCQLCGKRPSLFHFELAIQKRTEKSCHKKGFCCHTCATRLLRTLELSESRQWNAEAAALAADDFDTAEFHQRLESLRSVLDPK
jgi:hypothetical protein